MEYTNAFVCLLGVGTVFFGLLCIVALTAIMGKVVAGMEKNKKTAPVAQPTAPVVQEAIQNRPEFIAAVSAAIAEDMGTELSAIRIHSVKKI